MKRDVHTLSSREYDVIIVGAGIYGAAAALDAAQRGLSTVLIDQGDFGAATSANSLKIIHGGLRYLQQLDIKRFRESVRERRIMMYMAPHLVHPLPCVMPTYGYMMKGPLVMTAGLLLNDILSADRNSLADPEKKIPRGRVVSADRCRELVPGIDHAGVNGGAFWTDAQMYSSERLLLAFVKTAVRQGAAAANYVRAAGLIKEHDRVVGVQAEDCLDGGRFELRGKMVINTAGAWVDDLDGVSGDVAGHVNLSTAMNLVVNRQLLPETAAGIFAPFIKTLPDGSEYRGRHVLFMTPWRGRTIIGTYHLPYEGRPGDMRVSEAEVCAFLEEINGGFPNDPVQRSEVTACYKGFLPMDGISKKTGEVQLKKHYAFIDYEKKYKIKGLISVVGVKYTTARDVAAKTIDLALAKMGRTRSGSVTHRTRLAGGDIEHFEDFRLSVLRQKPQGVTDTVMEHLVKMYGTEYRDILAAAADMRDGDKPLPGSDEVIHAEALHAVRNEMAVTLSDIVMRRTDLGSAGEPPAECLEACAAIAAKELGWDAARTEREIENVKAVYRTC